MEYILTKDSFLVQTKISTGNVITLFRMSLIDNDLKKVEKEGHTEYSQTTPNYCVKIWAEPSGFIVRKVVPGIYPNLGKTRIIFFDEKNSIIYKRMDSLCLETQGKKATNKNLEQIPFKDQLSCVIRLNEQEQAHSYYLNIDTPTISGVKTIAYDANINRIDETAFSKNTKTLHTRLNNSDQFFKMTQPSHTKNKKAEKNTPPSKISSFTSILLRELVRELYWFGTCIFLVTTLKECNNKMEPTIQKMEHFLHSNTPPKMDASKTK